VIGWRLAGFDEVPLEDEWLLPEERRTLAGLRLPKRRADWRAGRWVAKHAVGTAVGVHASHIEIRAAGDGAPEAWLGGARLPVSVSISHRAGRAASVVADPETPVGCDLELIEPRDPAFVTEWFTDSERAWVARAAPATSDLLVTVIWSCKESALKVVRAGLRRETRSVLISDTGTSRGRWRRLRVDDAVGGSGYDAWWRRDGQLVLTVVARPLTEPPLELPDPRNAVAAPVPGLAG
jgi:4'-phosphopantetheinyl transferase